MRLLLLFFCAGLLAGCAKVSGPLKLYFIGSARFTAGNRTAGPADTLSARLYIDDTNADPPGLTNLRVTVDYMPRRLPFVYPSPLSSFLLANVPGDNQIVYLDSTFTTPPKELIYTALFGVRTSVGTERWTFTATDRAGNSAARGFVISQRRADSAAVYNDYTLRLNLPANGAAARRFVDLKSGLAFPSCSVSKSSASALQQLTDMILLSNGTLASPDALPATAFNATTWPTANRRTTRFYLTSLIAAATATTPAGTPTFANITDTLGIRQRFVPPGVSQLPGPSVGQVYAFRVQGQGGKPSQYGLFTVVNLNAGYQLQVHVAKQPL